jgi:hypothetical protein
VSFYVKNPLMPKGLLLREAHENSNYILLRIPIEISNIAHGERAILFAEGPLHCSLSLGTPSPGYRMFVQSDYRGP